MNIDLPTLLSTLGISSATAAWLTQTLVSQQLKKELQSQKYKFDKELTKFKSSHEGRIKKDVELFGGWQRLVNFTPISLSNLCTDMLIRF